MTTEKTTEKTAPVSRKIEPEQFNISSEDLTSIFNEQLPLVDFNHDGLASWRELQSGYKSAPDLRTKLALEAIAHNESGLRRLSNDQVFQPEAGVSVADMKEYLRLSAKKGVGVSDSTKTLLENVQIHLPGHRDISDPRTFAYALVHDLPYLDTNGDGEVTREELRDITHSKGNTPPELFEIANRLHSNFDAFKQSKDGTGIKKTDAQSFFNNYHNYYSGDSYRRQLSGVRSEAFWSAAPKAAGAVGILALSAAVGAIAVVDPEPLTKCFVGAHAVAGIVFGGLMGFSAYTDYANGEKKVARLQDIHEIQAPTVSRYGFR